MKKAKVLLTCLGAFVAVLLMGTAPAYSSGYPFAVGLAYDSDLIIVVGKFDSSAFTANEAESYSQTLADSVSMLGQSVVVLTPSDIASYGITDADVLKDGIKNVYMSSGFSVYVFMDVTKVNSVSPEYGKNIKIDVWVADYASFLGLPGSYLYVTTLEVPEFYLSLLSQPIIM